MSTLKLKKYKFEITIEAIPYEEKNVKCLYGEDSEYSEQFPEYVFALEILEDVFERAVVSLLQSGMKVAKDHLTSKEVLKKLEEYVDTIKQIQTTIKMVKE